GVAFAERTVECTHESHSFINRILRQTQTIGQLAALEVDETDRGINSSAQNLLWRTGSDFFDLYSAFGTRHHCHARRSPVNDHTEVIFFGNVAALLDRDFLHLFTLGTGLMGDQFFAE